MEIQNCGDTRAAIDQILDDTDELTREHCLTCNECSRENCDGCDYADKQEDLARRNKTATAV